MIEVTEALAHVMAHARPREPELCELTQAFGKVLARPLINPSDIPPFDKSLMDGFAVRSQDILAPDTQLRLVGTGMAGDPPPKELPTECAMLIMTGAVLPAGADAVVVREQATRGEEETDGRVTIHQYPVHPEQNLMRRGQICMADVELFAAETTLTAAEVGVLAETGHAQFEVIPPARVAILATGNELVPVGQLPQPGQIRNSNGPMLLTMAKALGCAVTDLGIGADDSNQLAKLIRAGLKHDVLVLSGGVSAGDLDLVPELLHAADVTQVFHKVRVKPGKPIWFGVSSSRGLVFGLPGNPVSSLVCFRLFVEPALRRLAGQPESTTWRGHATLANRYAQRGDRPTYFPSQITRQPDGQWSLSTLAWLGSSDLHTFTEANCLAIFPAGESQFEPGQLVQFLPLSSPV